MPINLQIEKQRLRVVRAGSPQVPRENFPFCVLPLRLYPTPLLCAVPRTPPGIPATMHLRLQITPHPCQPLA